MVTKQDVINSLREMGVKESDSILVHSSFKSLGEVENGADTIVTGMLETVGPQGNVVFPTLCIKDWEHVYVNWHMDAESDVGYLTNYFRKLPNAFRSNQATHSVAAIGYDAEYITATHGQSGRRHGIYGDTPFSADSPWEKLYHMNVKIIFLGVGMRYCTYRHFAEYRYMDKYLKKAERFPQYEALKERVWEYARWDQKGCWPHIKNPYIQELMEREDKVYHGRCGNADLIMINCKDFVDTCSKAMEAKDPEAISSADIMIDWWNEIDSL